MHTRPTRSVCSDVSFYCWFNGFRLIALRQALVRKLVPPYTQAVLMLAARYYEDRSDDGARHSLPMGVSALIERWRAVRVLAGRGAR